MIPSSNAMFGLATLTSHTQNFNQFQVICFFYSKHPQYESFISYHWYEVCIWLVTGTFAIILEEIGVNWNIIHQYVKPRTMERKISARY